ncbi:hypothetical protein EIP91_003657 [Steccherinum ochraceum]|uniref:Uncharacterized protein n=1 Tax=Steccherinum ochraceum TaxID=92696 RepID=A0A4R0RCN2_9APHY|nr:hypothetical protein EIP91_003657 [Steccherinum ochraceum]
MRAISIVNDLVVLCLTWMKTADVWRASLELENFKPALTTLLLRDGSLYFGSRLLLNIVVLTLDVLAVDSVDSTAFMFVVDALTTNLMTRFIMDLRCVASSRNTTVGESSARFTVGSFMGNMGAPLKVADSTWASCSADDVDHERPCCEETTESRFCVATEANVSGGESIR